MNVGKHRGNPKCIKTGEHAWVQSVSGMVGTDRCSRKGCDATRVNPRLIQDDDELVWDPPKTSDSGGSATKFANGNETESRT